MACARPSRQSKSGGRLGAVSSERRREKIWGERSGSWVARAQRPERVRDGGVGIGKEVGGWVRGREARCGFEREMRERREVV